MSTDVAPAPQRFDLDETSWVEFAPRWFVGGDDLLFEVQEALPWRQGKRVMWGKVVDEPRLTVGCAIGSVHVSETVRGISERLSRQYGEQLSMLWANWYRSGSDAVSWHGDRVARWAIDPTVAIVSLGGPRRFTIKPRPGHDGLSKTFSLASGDLLVMRGRCQVDFLHAVPRQAGAAPRVSLTFRVPDPNRIDEGAYVGYG